MKGGLLIVATLLILCVLETRVTSKGDGGYHLNLSFYSKTCPQAENIVSQVVLEAILQDRGIAAGLIRLHFHDCFVKGCDASILLDATPLGDVVEKQAPANGKSLRGFEVIDEAKDRIEEECPGIVSCADILAFAARDSAVNSGLDFYQVPSGRRDGRTSRANDTLELPSPFLSVDAITRAFAKKGLNQEEMVTLSGAHSIGVAHCSSFTPRLQNFNINQPQDWTLDESYTFRLNLMCPVFPTQVVANSGPEVVLDEISPWTLDNAYYVGLTRGKGLLPSDLALMNDSNTRKKVEWMALHPSSWSKKFGKAMVKVGKIEVLTGKQGEIRHQCHSVN